MFFHVEDNDIPAVENCYESMVANSITIWKINLLWLSQIRAKQGSIKDSIKIMKNALEMDNVGDRRKLTDGKRLLFLYLDFCLKNVEPHIVDSVVDWTMSEKTAKYLTLSYSMLLQYLIRICDSKRASDLSELYQLKRQNKLQVTEHILYLAAKLDSTASLELACALHTRVSGDMAAWVAYLSLIHVRSYEKAEKFLDHNSSEFDSRIGKSSFDKRMRSIWRENLDSQKFNVVLKQCSFIPLNTRNLYYDDLMYCYYKLIDWKSALLLYQKMNDQGFKPLLNTLLKLAYILLSNDQPLPFEIADPKGLLYLQSFVQSINQSPIDVERVLDDLSELATEYGHLVLPEALDTLLLNLPHSDFVPAWKRVCTLSAGSFPYDYLHRSEVLARHVSVLADNGQFISAARLLTDAHETKPSKYLHPNILLERAFKIQDKKILKMLLVLEKGFPELRNKCNELKTLQEMKSLEEGKIEFVSKILSSLNPDQFPCYFMKHLVQQEKSLLMTVIKNPNIQINTIIAGIFLYGHKSVLLGDPTLKKIIEPKLAASLRLAYAHVESLPDIIKLNSNLPSPDEFKIRISFVHRLIMTAFVDVMMKTDVADPDNVLREATLLYNKHKRSELIYFHSHYLTLKILCEKKSFLRSCSKVD